MKKVKTIVVLHPGAIGDVMLATPVAATLRLNYPEAQLIYWTHESLSDLLGLCGAIDRIVPFHKEGGFFDLRRMLAGFDAQLIVDLAGSSRSQWLTFMAGADVVRYRKQPPGVVPVQHAVENFLAALSPLALKPVETNFPTLSMPAELLAEMTERLADAGAANRLIVGLVPGVGKLRSHRAWIEDGWIYLARIIARSGRYFTVLLGGEDDATLCQTLAGDVEDGCLSMAGILTLAETAAVAKLCRVVVSADTGPAHIAVAAGTPVVGLYGPTLPERSGPYGYSDLLVSQSHRCQCQGSKFCTVIGASGPGECMRTIMLEEVCAQLRSALKDEAL